MSVKLNKPGRHIVWFDDLGSGNEEYRFLSNFYRGEPFTFPGLTWDRVFYGSWSPDVIQKLFGTDTVPDTPVEFTTGEHAFAAMKAYGTDPETFYGMVHSDPDNPNIVKSMGRSVKLRNDWEVVKLDVMAAVLRAKFTLDREEGKRLLKTGDALLTEGTYWYDDVWGVILQQKDRPGRNWLGTLLMARRAELKAEKGGHGWSAKHDTLSANAQFVL